MKRLLFVCLLVGCEGGGADKLGPKPTEIVLAQANKEKQDQAPKAYVDPYADSTQITIEKKNLTRACDEVLKKLSVVDTKKLPLTKEEKDAVAAVETMVPEACAATSPNLVADLKLFSALAQKSYYLVNDFRIREFEGLDLATGKVDAAKNKSADGFENAAIFYELAGNHATDQLQAYLMFAPLTERDQTVQAFFDLISLLPPDFADIVKNKRLGKALAAEENEELKAKLKGKIYGQVP